MKRQYTILRFLESLAARLPSATFRPSHLRYALSLVLLVVSSGLSPVLVAQKFLSPCTPALKPDCRAPNLLGCLNLPRGATDITIGPYEDVVDGPVDQLYPGVDTSTDDWYFDHPELFPCPSIGGEAPRFVFW